MENVLVGKYSSALRARSIATLRTNLRHRFEIFVRQSFYEFHTAGPIFAALYTTCKLTRRLSFSATSTREHSAVAGKLFHGDLSDSLLISQATMHMNWRFNHLSIYFCSRVKKSQNHLLVSLLSGTVQWRTPPFISLHERTIKQMTAGRR